MKYQLKKIQVSGALKDIYIVSNYACYNHNISELSLNTILTKSISNGLSTYFYDTKVVQILYPISCKINVMTCFFIFLL